MEDSKKTILLHDYRDDIVERKHKSDLFDWGQWPDWHILYKTLAYERCSSRDVESYPYVRNAILEGHEVFKGCFDSPYIPFTFDIMNGWWFCFKDIFHIDNIVRNSKSEKDKKAKDESLQRMMDIMKKNGEECGELIKTYNVQYELFESFINYLRVVYTVGNITPVPKGCNRYSGDLDTWEYKINRDGSKYSGNYIERLCFNDYDNKIITKEEYEKDKTSYLKGRTILIMKRGLRYLGFCEGLDEIVESIICEWNSPKTLFD